MKIERISDDKVKFTFNIIDLKERDIKLSDLAHGGPKTYRLLQDMKQAAYEACGFDVGDLPVMMETMPFGANQVIIVVTKIPGTPGINDEDFCPAAEALARHNQQEKAFAPYEKEPVAVPAIAVFSFDELDNVSTACGRVFHLYPAHMLFSKTSLYKNESRYFLVAEIDDPTIMSKVIAVLSEYGERHAATHLSKHYLAEHGEVFFTDRAVETLALRM